MSKTSAQERTKARASLILGKSVFLPMVFGQGYSGLSGVETNNFSITSSMKIERRSRGKERRKAYPYWQLLMVDVP
jgi:hypothetical protein